MFNKSFGLFFIRALLGLIFLMQGFGKVFTWGLQGVYQSAFAPFEALGFPSWLLWGTAWYTSVVELVGGIMLLAGWYRKQTFVALGTVLLIVAFGHGWQQPIWDLQHVFVRAVLLGALLLLPAEWDQWSLDEWRKSA